MAYASRRSSYLVGSMGAFLQVFAVWWDSYSPHQVGTFDSWWNPTYIALYVGFTVVVWAIWSGLRVPRIQPPSTVPIRFVNLAGLKLAAAGLVLEVVVWIWIDITRQFFFSEPNIASAFSLWTMGMLTVALGMVIGLTIELGMIRHEMVAASTCKRWLTLLCVALTFASIWLTTSGVFLYFAEAFQTSSLNLVAAVFLSLVAPLVLVPAKRVLPKFGAALAIGVIFNLVTGFVLVLVARTPAYVPWGLLPLALFEILIMGLKRVMNITWAGPVASIVIGLFFWATYYPFTLYLFPWSSSPQLSLAAVVLGSLAGAFLGNLTYAGLTSAVLGDVTG
ncbi:MAG: hypothetical protein ABSE39_07785 [Candidatus Bathyarchaeia archaeon]